MSILDEKKNPVVDKKKSHIIAVKIAEESIGQNDLGCPIGDDLL